MNESAIHKFCYSLVPFIGVWGVAEGKAMGGGICPQTLIRLRQLGAPPPTANCNPSKRQTLNLLFEKLPSATLQNQIFKKKITLRYNHFYFAEFSICGVFPLGLFDTGAYLGGGALPCPLF